MVEEPTESDVVANPLALVVLVVGLTAPAPELTAHVTTTFGTACPAASSAVTLSGVGSGLLKYQLCASPPLFTRSVGGPGGWVPPPPHRRTQQRPVPPRMPPVDSNARATSIPPRNSKWDRRRGEHGVVPSSASRVPAGTVSYRSLLPMLHSATASPLDRALPRPNGRRSRWRRWARGCAR